MENDVLLDQLSDKPSGMTKRDMPSAGDMITLGILSIVLCMGLIGIILAIVALTRCSQALKDYRSFPDMWTETSIAKVKASQICAIVSLSLFGLILLLGIVANL